MEDKRCTAFGSAEPSVLEDEAAFEQPYITLTNQRLEKTPIAPQQNPKQTEIIPLYVKNNTSGKEPIKLIFDTKHQRQKRKK